MFAASSSSSNADRLGKGLALLSFLLFALTSSRFAYPDESALLLAQHLHLTPFRPLSHPLWGWIVQALAAVRVGPASFLPNLFSAFCGAGCILLIYRLVRRMEVAKSHERFAPSARLLAASGAALFMAVTPPVWMVSNRAHPGSLDLLLLLALLWLFSQFKRRGTEKRALAISLLLGLGVAESATMALFFPLFCLYGLVLLRAQKLLTRRIVGRSALMLLPGGLVYLLSAWTYYRSPIAGWREFSGIGQTLWYILLDQWLAIKGGIPRQGWLLLFFSVFLPWACCVWMPRAGTEDSSRRFGLCTLMTVVSGLSIAILLNAPFSPWRLTAQSSMTVAPYIMIAANFGYAVGYWYGFFAEAAARRYPPGRVHAGLFAVVVGLLILVAGWRNHATANTRGADLVNQLARAMVSHREGRTLIMTEGLLDANLMLAARDLRVKVEVANLRLAASLPFRRYVSSMTASPRLQALAQVGLLPFMTQWLKTDAGAADRVAIQMSPDLWLAAGKGILPNGSLYLGADGMASTDGAALIVKSRPFWQLAGRSLDGMRRGAPAVRKLGEALGKHLSSVANDLGVYLENSECFREAIEAYQAAIRLAPKNLSAHLNLRVALQTDGQTDEAARIDSAAEWLASAQKMTLKSLVDTYGHVRTKSAMERLRELWAKAPAQSSSPSPDLQVAIDAVARGDYKAAREKLEKMVRDQPRVEQAWILLASVAREERDSATFAKCLQRMRSEEKEWPQVLVMAGEDAFERQDLAAARTYFERAAFLWPQDLGVLEQLVKLDLMEKKYTGVASRLDSLLTYDSGNAIGNFGLGVILFERHEPDLAEEAYRTALLRQRYPPALNNLAWLLQSRGQLDEALALAREATTADPTSYNAWDTLGVIQGKLKSYDDASSSLKMAVTINPRTPEARVHLLQLLAMKGQTEEASAGARALVETAPELPDELKRDLRALLK